MLETDNGNNNRDNAIDNNDKHNDNRLYNDLSLHILRCKAYSHRVVTRASRMRV